MAGHPAAPIPEGAGPEEVSIQANCKGRHGADWLVRCTKAPLKREQKSAAAWNCFQTAGTAERSFLERKLDQEADVTVADNV